MTSASFCGRSGVFFPAVAVPRLDVGHDRHPDSLSDRVPVPPFRERPSSHPARPRWPPFRSRRAATSTRATRPPIASAVHPTVQTATPPDQHTHQSPTIRPNELRSIRLQGGGRIDRALNFSASWVGGDDRPMRIQSRTSHWAVGSLPIRERGVTGFRERAAVGAGCGGIGCADGVRRRGGNSRRERGGLSVDFG